eukprot:g26154.t1
MRKTKSFPGEVCAGLKVSPHFALLGFMFTARSVPSAEASAASEKLPLSVEDEAASERRSLEESQRTTSAKDAQVLGDTAGRSSVTVMTYWLQVESIKGLPRLENAETVSLYEVHSYWMEQGGPMVRLAELQAHAADGGEECRVRNQVSLPLFEPAPGAGTVAVEVVRKVPENSKGSFMLVGRVELDALNDDTRRIASYALPPSAAVIKLRVCEHRAAVKASGVVTQPPAATQCGQRHSRCSEPCSGAWRGEGRATSERGQCEGHREGRARCSEPIEAGA